MLDNIHYISQGNTVEEQLTAIQNALEAGCKLIQLRFKKTSKEEFLKVGREVRSLCSSYQAIFIVNDFVDLAIELQADGVHLGLTDTSIKEARALLGYDAIIGGTANTLKDVLQRIEEGCDYAGVGPFRFTTTKEKLSPILGTEGFKSIHEELESRGVSIPIYAIGGIELEDIEEIMNSGVYGVAISGLITHASNRTEVVNAVRKKIENYVTNRK